MVRAITCNAEEVRRVRLVLKLTQAEFAQRLGVSRRTVVRGEQRGIEIPYFSVGETGRDQLLGRWQVLEREAAGLKVDASEFEGREEHRLRKSRRDAWRPNRATEAAMMQYARGERSEPPAIASTSVDRKVSPRRRRRAARRLAKRSAVRPAYRRSGRGPARRAALKRAGRPRGRLPLRRRRDRSAIAKVSRRRRKAARRHR